MPVRPCLVKPASPDARSGFSCGRSGLQPPKTLITDARRVSPRSRSNRKLNFGPDSYDKRAMPSLRRTSIRPSASRRRASPVFSDAVNADFAAFLGSSGEPPITFTARADGRIDGFNERWFSFTGLEHSTNEFFGWQRAIHADDILGFLEHWTRAVRTGNPFQLDCRLRQRDGEYRWFHCRALPYYDEKCSIVHWLGACTEVVGDPESLVTGVADEIVQSPANVGGLEPVVEQVQRDLAVIEQTLAAGDSDLIARIAQGLQDTATRPAASSIDEIATDLEQFAQAGHLETAESCIARLRHQVDECLNPDTAARMSGSPQGNP